MKSLIRRDKKYCFGKPRIAGTRITVSVVKGWYNGGAGISMIKNYYPNLNEQQILAAINYCRKDKVK